MPCGWIFAITGLVMSLFLVACNLDRTPRPPDKNSFHIVFDVTGSTKNASGRAAEQFSAIFHKLPAHADFRASLLLGMNSELKSLLSMQVPDDTSIEHSETRADVIGRILREVAKHSREQDDRGGHSCLLRTLIYASVQAPSDGVPNLILLSDGEEDCVFQTATGSSIRVEVVKYQLPEEAADAIPSLELEVSSKLSQIERTSVTFLVQRKLLQSDRDGHKSVAWLERFWRRVFENQHMKWRNLAFRVEISEDLKLFVSP